MIALSLLHTALATTPTVDAPLRTGVSSSGDAAVVIGVEDYAFLPDVPYAASDANTLYQTMVYTRGIPPERVQLLKGGNREQILSAIERAARSASGGQLWITFAGHGAASPDDGGLLLVGDDAKSDPSVFVSRSVSLAEILEVAGPEATLILDTCHAGRGSAGADLVDGARFAVPTFAGARDSGVRVWTAARPSQISQPYEPASHGLFTYFVAGALRGWADGEFDGTPDGAVTLSEAQAFVSRAIATVHPSGQTPTLEGSGGIEWVRSERLEPAPDLALLPKLGGTSAAIVSLPVPLPRPTTSRSSHRIAVPVTFQGRGVMADASGRTVGLSELLRATQGYAATDQAAKRYQSALAIRTTGVTTSLLGVIYGGVYGAQILRSGDHSTLPLAFAGLAGFGVWGVGAAMVPRARERYLDAANTKLAEL